VDQFLATLTDNWDLFLGAFGMTLRLLVVSAVAALLLGTLLAAFRVSPSSALRGFGAAYVTVLRNTPLTLLFVFVAFGWPLLDVNLSYFTFAVIALSLYTAAFVCEAVRSGINTVAAGQSEAARAIGMGFGQTLGLVILPQAFRAVVPPLASILIALAKNTTVASGFGVVESGGLGATLNEQGYSTVYALLWVVVGFLVLVLPMSAVQRQLERRWRVA
jgi:glutamate transport system permease protein